jgi:hypothetical protein
MWMAGAALQERLVGRNEKEDLPQRVYFPAAPRENMAWPLCLDELGCIAGAEYLEE